MVSLRRCLRAPRLLALVLLLALAPHRSPAATADSTILDRYLSSLSTWTADFSQTVIDSRGKQAGVGRGRLLIVRPGKFRWESSPQGASGEAAQLLIADGRNLWFYDRDLAQATVKAADKALPQSPAMLLAGGGNLRAAFSLQANGKRDGLEWVRVVPRDVQSDFREALFGFKLRELQRLVIVDKLGQRSTLNFSKVQRNGNVDPKLLSFTVPIGVDLIGTPVSP
jgi:outer membrane lipoprotein carrier protein